MPRGDAGSLAWTAVKPLLKRWLLDGTITDEMEAGDVYTMRQEFDRVPKNRFETNFNKLKEGVRTYKERALIDEAGFLRDKELYPLAKDTPGYWDGSEAQQLLKEDIRMKRHEEMKPMALWNSRPQYQEFELRKFRDHIHQELRNHREKPYWLAKKKSNTAKYEARIRKVFGDQDADFLRDPSLAVPDAE
jgi:hypothetical protein